MTAPTDDLQELPDWALQWWFFGGHEGPTPEGLDQRFVIDDDGSLIVQEVGKLDFVIYQYHVQDRGDDWCLEDHSLECLVRRLKELEDKCAEMGNLRPTPIDLQLWRWNRRRAARRVRRFIEEKSMKIVELPRELQSIIDRVLLEGPEKDIDATHAEELLLESYGLYAWRRDDLPILVLGPLPGALNSMVSEATEAYCLRLLRTTVAICGVATEEAFRFVVKSVSAGNSADPINEWRLGVLLSSLRPDVLSPGARSVAYKIADERNSAVHDGEYQPSDDVAYGVLVSTYKLLRHLSQKGLLEPSAS